MPGKQVTALIKLQIPAGKATPAPPIGPALGSHGVNPVEITVYADRTFSFKLKTPPAAALLKQAAKVKKGAANPLTTKVGSVTMDQCREIAKTKLADLSANDVEAGAKIIAGTARSMGITVTGK
jgi:large subunit ribosomal protein L11